MEKFRKIKIIKWTLSIYDIVGGVGRGSWNVSGFIFVKMTDVSGHVMTFCDILWRFVTYYKNDRHFMTCHETSVINSFFFKNDWRFMYLSCMEIGNESLKELSKNINFLNWCFWWFENLYFYVIFISPFFSKRKEEAHKKKDWDYYYYLGSVHKWHHLMTGGRGFAKSDRGGGGFSVKWRHYN